MKDKVICYVQKKNGRFGKTKSINGSNPVFRGKAYTAPVKEKHEILDFQNFWGRKQMAFYKEGQDNPFPLGAPSKWKESRNHDEDVEMLVVVTKRALLESKGADLKQNVTMFMVMGVLGFLLVERLLFG